MKRRIPAKEPHQKNNPENSAPPFYFCLQYLRATRQVLKNATSSSRPIPKDGPISF